MSWRRLGLFLLFSTDRLDCVFGDPDLSKLLAFYDEMLGSGWNLETDTCEPFNGFGLDVAMGEMNVFSTEESLLTLSMLPLISLFRLCLLA